MVVSWTPLFVPFDFGGAAPSGKGAAKIATLQFPQRWNRKNPFDSLGWVGWFISPGITRSLAERAIVH
jgi:hypothetical protein